MVLNMKIKEEFNDNIEKDKIIKASIEEGENINLKRYYHSICFKRNSSNCSRV